MRRVLIVGFLLSALSTAASTEASAGGVSPAQLTGERDRGQPGLVSAATDSAMGGA